MLNLLNNRMRRPKGKPSNLRHEYDLRPKFGFVKELNGYRMNADSPILSYFGHVAEGHDSFGNEIRYVQCLIIHSHALQSHAGPS